MFEDNLLALNDGRPSMSESIPFEIWEQIFTFYLETAKLAFCLPFPCSLVIPQEGQVFCPALKLSWVCSPWRRVTFSRPTFWNSLCVSLSAIIDYPNRVELIFRYLTLSSGAPLDFSVDSETEADHPIVRTVFLALLDNCSRWNQIEYGGIHDLWLKYLKESRSSDDSTVCPVKFFKCFTDVPWEILSHCPQLQVYRGYILSAHELRMHSSSSLGGAGLLPNLTELELHYLEAETIGEVVHRFPLLKKLVLSIYSVSEWDNDHVRTEGITHRLENLSVLSVGPNAIREAEGWRNLWLPNLTVLELGMPADDDMLSYHDPADGDLHYGEAIEEFSKTLTRSGAVLQRVKLVLLDMQNMIDGHEALRFLAHHPTISDLTVSVSNQYYWVFRDLFIGMTLGQTRTSPLIVLPNLQSLSIFIDRIDLCRVINKLPSSRLPADIAFNICYDICRLVETRTLPLSDLPSGVVKLERLALDSKTLSSRFGEVFRNSSVDILERDVAEFRLENWNRCGVHSSKHE